MTTAAPTQPLTVELPVCPRCGRVGRLPNTNWGGKTACIGQPGQIHPRVRMVPKLFIEAPAEENA